MQCKLRKLSGEEIRPTYTEKAFRRRYTRNSSRKSLLEKINAQCKLKKLSGEDVRAMKTEKVFRRRYKRQQLGFLYSAQDTIKLTLRPP